MSGIFFYLKMRKQSRCVRLRHSVCPPLTRSKKTWIFAICQNSQPGTRKNYSVNCKECVSPYSQAQKLFSTDCHLSVRCHVVLVVKVVTAWFHCHYHHSYIKVHATNLLSSAPINTLLFIVFHDGLNDNASTTWPSLAPDVIAAFLESYQLPPCSLPPPAPASVFKNYTWAGHFSFRHFLHLLKGSHQNSLFTVRLTVKGGSGGGGEPHRPWP